MSTAEPSSRIAVEHRPDGSMIFTVTDLLQGTESAIVLDEAERRSLLRGIVNAKRDVRGYVVLTHSLLDGGGWATDGSGTFAFAAGTEALVGRLRDAGYPEAHVGMVLAVLGGPDDQMPASPTTSTSSSDPPLSGRRCGA